MATAHKRIYAVTMGATTRLVNASNKAQAVSHVARDTIVAGVATQGDLIALTKSGVEVETAGPDGMVGLCLTSGLGVKLGEVAE